LRVKIRAAGGKIFTVGLFRSLSKNGETRAGLCFTAEESGGPAFPLKIKEIRPHFESGEDESLLSSRMVPETGFQKTGKFRH
jgi:hypothetical protein